MSKNEYDVIIAGGGTAGVSCAWNSAKLGLKTLLIEQNSYLGGAITSSLVIPAMKNSANSINNQFYKKLYSELSAVNGAITYSDGNIGWFNPELTKIILDKMMKDVGVDVVFNSHISNIKQKENKNLSVHIETIYTNNMFVSLKELLLDIETRYLVDSTGDGKICQKLNCKILENSKENFQPVSLRFVMAGIDVETFAAWLEEYDSDRNVTTIAHINNEIHLSTAYTWDTNKKWALKPLFEDAIEKNILKYEDTNYFQIFTIAGAADSIAFNAPRLLNNDITETEAYIIGRESILRLSNFCKTYFPGFDKAYISKIADKIGIRTSYRIECEYIYTYEDLISGKKFNNPVVISDYPVDIHSAKQNSSTLEKVTQEYQLPVEALIVKGHSNLFVIGKCISTDDKAIGALRIIPSCFCMGEGLAKYISEK